MYRCELNLKEGWAPKNWCFWTVVQQKTLESPLDSTEIQLVHPKEDQSCVFIGRADSEALIPWPPDVKSQLIGKDPDDGKDWGQEEKGETEGGDRKWDGWMASPTQWTWVLANSEIVKDREAWLCCSPQSHKESDITVTEKQQQQMIITKTYTDNNSKRSNNTNDKHHISLFYLHDAIAWLLFYYVQICYLIHNN